MIVVVRKKVEEVHIVVHKIYLHVMNNTNRTFYSFGLQGTEIKRGGESQECPAINGDIVIPREVMV